MKIKVPKNNSTKITDSTKRRTTFNCPEGNFRGKFLEMKPVPDCDPLHPLVRVLFEMQIPSNPDRVLTRKDFTPDLSWGSKLRRFFEQWQGSDFFNNVEEVDFQSLRGVEADLSIVHYHNEGHANPYCDIRGAYPVGALELTVKPDANEVDRPVAHATAKGLIPQAGSINPFVGPYGLDVAQLASLLKQLAIDSPKESPSTGN